MSSGFGFAGDLVRYCTTSRSVPIPAPSSATRRQRRVAQRRAAWNETTRPHSHSSPWMTAAKTVAKGLSQAGLPTTTAASTTGEPSAQTPQHSTGRAHTPREPQGPDLRARTNKHRLGQPSVVPPAPPPERRTRAIASWQQHHTRHFKPTAHAHRLPSPRRPPAPHHFRLLPPAHFGPHLRASRLP